MKRFALLILLFLASLTSFSQETEKKPLKVGLVLSGGGAKGFAHIGVLKVLEEAGVKISYIGGTSMGAVVGGLYASGYNANQIDSIFKTTDFDKLLKDFIPRSSKNFYEKRNDELYAFTLPFHRFKVGIPTALSKGMFNYNLLTRLTHNVRHVRDFNKLPIPFLCMATNIETGEEVLLDKGYLPQAMLASSAFPSLFSPVEIDGKLLVDGGVTNNYPIEEVKKLGADFIIGVDVQDDLNDRTQLKDATKILVQISILQSMEKMKQKIAKTDIYIKPDITGFGVISFSDGQEIIEKGEEAAFAVYEKIKAIADQSNGFVKNNNRILSDSIPLKNIRINELENYTDSYVLGKLGFKSGKNISYNDFKIGIDNLTATQNFSAISYSLDPNNSRDDLNIYLTENPVKTFLKFGLHYDGLYKSGILLNLTQKKTFFKNDIASFDIVLGDNFRYNFDYYLDNGFHWSFGFKSRLNRFNKNVATDFSDGQLLAQLGINSINIDFSDFSNQAYLQTVFIQKFLIGAGLEYKHLRIKSKTLENSTPTLEKSDYLSAFGYLKYDSFDNKYFPKSGWYFSGDFQSYLFSSDYTNQFNRFSIAKGDIGIAKTFFKKVTLKLQTEAGFAMGKNSVPFFNFVLGGYGYSPVNNFKHFYGYDFLSINANSYIKSAFTLDYEIFKKNHLNFSANYANLGDNLFKNTDWISTPKYNGYAIGYGMETIIGPIEIKHSWSPELSKGFTWFTVGFWF
ncbi:patatin-like phospholipase family protein [Flavobacterium sp.]|uniref:patatin-like phospholipase family protein n=1 Tax=Flavobacterium sp. TaxID=239 RepID=UPI002B4B773E|nr:patatin-like phospholipase family protein [Flavobacterium sp.]HLF50776.1 patatin-like phospholipase family protein [Flavobacterium sp.]